MDFIVCGEVAVVSPHRDMTLENHKQEDQES